MTLSRKHLLNFCALLILSGCAVQTTGEAPDHSVYDLRELTAAWTADDIARLLGGTTGASMTPTQREAATQRLLQQLTETDSSPEIGRTAYIGSIGEAALLDQLSAPLNHATLLDQQQMLAHLGRVMADGVITGFDLRVNDVYAGFPPDRTLVYSHSSVKHLLQLVLVFAAHQLDARVYLTPKVSAFLYRDGWSGEPENLQALPDGSKIINGREMAVLFEFPRASDRLRFHQLVLQYAKKDNAEESGLIADAWWQPFYYADTPIAGFKEIALTYVSDGRYEATLTSTLERQALVQAAVSRDGLAVRTDSAWVNPAFYRFLTGDYR